MKPQPMSPMRGGATWYRASLPARRPGEELPQRLVGERRQRLAALLRRGLRGDMPSEQRIFERHQDEVDHLACQRFRCHAWQITLLRVAPQDRGERPLPEVSQMSVLLQGGLVAAETFQKDQAQEVAVLVHDVD